MKSKCAFSLVPRPLSRGRCIKLLTKMRILTLPVPYHSASPVATASLTALLAVSGSSSEKKSEECIATEYLVGPITLSNLNTSYVPPAVHAAAPRRHHVPESREGPC